MTAPVRIGDLKHRVAIERALRAGDGGGGAIVTWERVGEVWAAIWPRQAAEEFTLDRVAGKATHDVWMRSGAPVKPEMRLRAGEREFDVRGVIVVEERGRWMKCVVEERDL